MSFPRIWELLGKERRVIGETRVSWIVLNDDEIYTDAEISAAVAADSKAKPWWWKHSVSLVNKKEPNANPLHPRWFFSESDRDDFVWARNHFNRIQEAMGRYSRAITVAQLRQIAAVIDYDDETQQIRKQESKANG